MATATHSTTSVLDNPKYRPLLTQAVRDENYLQMLFSDGLRHGQVLQPSQLEAIARSEQCPALAQEFYREFVEEEYRARQQPYAKAVEQVGKIETLPQRFGEAKALIQKVQEEAQQLRRGIIEKMRSDYGFGFGLANKYNETWPSQTADLSDPEQIKRREWAERASLDELFLDWTDHLIKKDTFEFYHPSLIKLERFVADYSDAVDGIKRAIASDQMIGSYLGQEKTYSFVVEPEKVVLFAGLIHKAIQEMSRKLSSDNPRSIFNPLYDVWKPIYDALEWAMHFACGKVQRRGKPGISQDRFYLNEKAVQVLREYPIPEARRGLETEIERLSQQADKRKVLVAAKLDAEIAEYRLKQLKGNRDMEYALQDHERAGTQKQQIQTGLASSRASLSDLLGNSVTVLRNTGVGQPYIVRIDAVPDVAAEIDKTRKAIEKYESQISGYDTEIRNIRGGWFAGLRKGAVSRKDAKRTGIKNQHDAAKTELQTLEEKKRAIDELCRVLSIDPELGESFTNLPMALRDLIDRAQAKAETRYEALAHLSGNTRNTFISYIASEEEHRQAQANFRALWGS